MDVLIARSWKQALDKYFESESFRSLAEFVRGEYAKKKILPEKKNIFRALNLTALEDVKVVIIGQDPYHGSFNGVCQAQGLSFSVPEGLRNPPSLQNIFKELEAEFGGKKAEAEVKFNGDLSCWAKQGVLLLNAVLTVESGRAGSHAGRGWEELTDEVIKLISQEREDVVFLLWGAYARKKKDLIDSKNHLVLESAHPSPLSAHAGFFGNGHFKKSNEWLKLRGLEEIIW
jgi:uracil-DNA glycosylase